MGEVKSPTSSDESDVTGGGHPGQGRVPALGFRAQGPKRVALNTEPTPDTHSAHRKELFPKTAEAGGWGRPGEAPGACSPQGRHRTQWHTHVIPALKKVRQEGHLNCIVRPCFKKGKKRNRMRKREEKGKKMGLNVGVGKKEKIKKYITTKEDMKVNRNLH